MERGRKRGGGPIINSFWLQQANNVLGRGGGFPKQPFYSTMPYNSPQQQGNGEEGGFLDFLWSTNHDTTLLGGEGEKGKFPLAYTCGHSEEVDFSICTTKKLKDLQQELSFNFHTHSWHSFVTPKHRLHIFMNAQVMY